MITRVFDSHDTELYSTWHVEDGGVVCLVIPDVGELRMSLAKAEDISKSLALHAEYGRQAAKVIPTKLKGK